jgi:hypothetical protein
VHHGFHDALFDALVAGKCPKIPENIPEREPGTLTKE